MIFPLVAITGTPTSPAYGDIIIRVSLVPRPLFRFYVGSGGTETMRNTVHVRHVKLSAIATGSLPAQRIVEDFSKDE